MQLDAGATSKTASASRASASGSNCSGCGPGTTRKRTGAEGTSSVAQPVLTWSPSGRPGAGVQLRPPDERAGAEPGQLVAGDAPEPLRPEEAARHREIGAAAAALAADLEHLTGGQRQQPALRRRVPVHADLRCGAHGSDIARTEATKPGPTPREPERAGVRGVADKPVRESERHRIGRIGARDPVRGDGVPATVLHDRPQPRGHDLEHGALLGRHRRRWRCHRRWLDLLARPGNGEADPISGCQHGEGPTFRGEEGEAGPADQIPSTRRRRRVHGGVPVGDRHRPGGDERARAGAPRHTLQLGGQPSEVGCSRNPARQGLCRRGSGVSTG